MASESKGRRTQEGDSAPAPASGPGGVAKTRRSKRDTRLHWDNRQQRAWVEPLANSTNAGPKFRWSAWPGRRHKESSSSPPTPPTQPANNKDPACTSDNLITQPTAGYDEPSGALDGLAAPADQRRPLIAISAVASTCPARAASATSTATVAMANPCRSQSTSPPPRPTSTSSFGHKPPTQSVHSPDWCKRNDEPLGLDNHGHRANPIANDETDRRANQLMANANDQLTGAARVSYATTRQSRQVEDDDDDDDDISRRLLQSTAAAAAVASINYQQTKVVNGDDDNDEAEADAEAEAGYELDAMAADDRTPSDLSSFKSSSISATGDGFIVDNVRENFVNLIRYNKLQYFYVGVLLYSVINVILLLGYSHSSTNKKDHNYTGQWGPSTEPSVGSTDHRQQSELELELESQLQLQQFSNDEHAASATTEMDSLIVWVEPETVATTTTNGLQLLEDTNEISGLQDSNNHDANQINQSTNSGLDSKWPSFFGGGGGGGGETKTRAAPKTLYLNCTALAQAASSRLHRASRLLVVFILLASCLLVLIVASTLYEFNETKPRPQVPVESGGAHGNIARAAQFATSCEWHTCVRSAGLLLAFVLLVVPICSLHLACKLHPDFAPDPFASDRHHHQSNSTPTPNHQDDKQFDAPQTADYCKLVDSPNGSSKPGLGLHMPVGALVMFIYTIALHLDELPRCLLGLAACLCLTVVALISVLLSRVQANDDDPNPSSCDSCVSWASLGAVCALALASGLLKAYHSNRFTNRRVFQGANKLIEAKVSLEQQRQQQETLLLSVLPAYVAEQVKRNMVKKMANLEAEHGGTNGDTAHQSASASCEPPQQQVAPIGPLGASGGPPASASANEHAQHHAPVSVQLTSAAPTSAPSATNEHKIRCQLSAPSDNRGGGAQSPATVGAAAARIWQRPLGLAIRGSPFNSSLGSNEHPASAAHKRLGKTTPTVVHQLSLAAGQQASLHHHKLAASLSSNSASQQHHHSSAINLCLNPVASDGGGAGRQASSARRGFNELYIRTYNNVSLLYGDIVGFTRLCSLLSSSQLVSVLNDLFSHFDHLAERHKIMRIKILGDCYYGVSGIPEFAVMGAKSRTKSAGGDNHAINCVNMGLDMIKYIKCLNIRRSMDDATRRRQQLSKQRPADEQLEAEQQQQQLAQMQMQLQMPAFELNMRIGVHTGHIHSGVIGLKKWQFDIWSNDVSIAMHCESSGVAGRVQVTEATVQQLHNEFEVEPAPGSERDQLLANRGIRTYLICSKIGASTRNSRLVTPATGQLTGGGGGGEPAPAGACQSPLLIKSHRMAAKQQTLAAIDTSCEFAQAKIRQATIGTIRQILLAGETANACTFNAYALALDHNDLGAIDLAFNESQLEKSFARRLIASSSRLGELGCLFVLLVVAIGLLNLQYLAARASATLAPLVLISALAISLLLIASVAFSQPGDEVSPQTATPTVAASDQMAHEQHHLPLAHSNGHDDDEQQGDHSDKKHRKKKFCAKSRHHLIEIAPQQAPSGLLNLLQWPWFAALIAFGRQQVCKRSANSRLSSWAILAAYLLVILEQAYLMANQIICPPAPTPNPMQSATSIGHHLNSPKSSEKSPLAIGINSSSLMDESSPAKQPQVLAPTRSDFDSARINQLVEQYQLIVIIVLIALDLSANLVSYRMKSNFILAIISIQAIVLIANPFYTSELTADNRQLQSNSSNRPKWSTVADHLGALLCPNDEHKRLDSFASALQDGQAAHSPPTPQPTNANQQEQQRYQELLYRSSDALLLILALWSLAFARQLDYTNRTNFLWRNRLNVDHEELEYISGINKVLLENILPSHVVQHYLTTNHNHNHSNNNNNNNSTPASTASGGQQEAPAAFSTKVSIATASDELDPPHGSIGGTRTSTMMMMAGSLRYLSYASSSPNELYHEQHESVAVMFASIPHFYEFYDESDISKQGLGCIALLNEIICDFDKLLLKNKFSRIEKIKTIGSTYMAAAGLRPCHQLSSRHSAASQISQASGMSLAACGASNPIKLGPRTTLSLDKMNEQQQQPQNNQLIAPDSQLEARKRLVLNQQKLNLICMIQFATSLMSALNCINKQSFQVFKLRVGVNTGPVIAGVIGAQRPFYDIWGDCVNIASRMESLGEIGRVQVEERTAKLLMECLCGETYAIVRRGAIEVKGKGGMVTYFVDKKSPSTNFGAPDVAAK